MLKITRKFSELLKNLSNKENVDNHEFLLGESGRLKHNLLTFYSVAGSQINREKMISLMSEAGYSLIDNLSIAKKDNMEAISLTEEEWGAKVDSQEIAEDLFMGEEDFMDLLPANGYFH